MSGSASFQSEKGTQFAFRLPFSCFSRLIGSSNFAMFGLKVPWSAILRSGLGCSAGGF